MKDMEFCGVPGVPMLSGNRGKRNSYVACWHIKILKLFALYSRKKEVVLSYNTGKFLPKRLDNNWTKYPWSDPTGAWNGIGVGRLGEED